MTYEGPLKIIILGGGIAGLAAADAVTRALERFQGPLPDGLEVHLVEAEAHMGGRAASWPIEELRALQPYGPYRATAPHGVHFIWGCYEHFTAFMREAGVALSPARATTTYCSWLAPPDIVTDEAARVVAFHVCDPSRPEDAFDPRARCVLRALRRHGSSLALVERMLGIAVRGRVSFEEYASYLDILFADDVAAPELRWRVFLSGVFSSVAGLAETSAMLVDLLDGRSPTDVDIGELMAPASKGGPRPEGPALPRARSIVERVFSLPAPARKDSQTIDRVVAGFDTARALAAMTGLVTRDAALVAARKGTFHPKRSGYLKNIFKAAFSSPFALDTATAIRDVQFGLRNCRGAQLRTFDGDDSRAAFDAVRRRIEARMASGRPRGSVRMSTWAKRIVVRDARACGVEIAAGAKRPAAVVPTVNPARAGRATATLEADLVVSSLLPRVLAAITPDAPAELLSRLETLGRFMSETVNLQLFFPEKHDLPFPAMPRGSLETPPMSISNIEGPFTIVVDCGRAWSREAFERIALTEDDARLGRRFDGTAWELVGAYADFFTFDEHAPAGRYQWPLDVQRRLAELLHDASDFLPETIDGRPWVHDVGAPGRLAPPPMGEVRPERADAYTKRWLEQASPLIAANAMRQLAALPGLAPRTGTYLRRQADAIERGDPTRVRWTLVRNCQAENRFFSAEPGIFAHRPHARFETELPGLFVCGDWTRNGLNLQSMEAAVVSGLQAAHAVLERMRAGGLEGLPLPGLFPDILPAGAWDTGM